jgi:predicted MFS family arabinose efflux permease
MTGALRARFNQLGLMLGAFVGATLLAKVFGAGWGTASGFGQIAFAAALVAVLLTDELPGG